MTTDLRAWRLPEDQFGALVQLSGQIGRPAIPALLGLAGRLHRAPLEDLGSLAALVTSEPVVANRHALLAEAILPTVLASIDTRLQALYRDHLTTTVGLEGVHWDRVEALSAVRDQAFAIVGSYDWHWLARWFGRRDADGLAWCLGRLSNLAFPCRYLNLRFTYHCNIECRHCYNDSGLSHRDTRLSLDQMLTLVREMPQAGIPGVNVTGGEPFLYPDDVLAIVREARRVGVSTVRIFTNGFWARSADSAAHMLGRLQEAGFGASATDLLKVSAGSFHREFLPNDVIGRIARPYAALFQRPLEADIEVDPAGDDRLKPIEFWTSASADTVTLVRREVSGVGRGAAVAVMGGDGGVAPCHLIDQLSIEPDGACRPCCGLNAHNSGVRVGRVGDHSLRELVKRMQNDPILQFLATRPLQQVFVYAGKPLPVAGRLCELCQAAIGNLMDREPMMAALEPQQRYYPFWFTDHPGSGR